ncbi:hypothetical protein VNO77_03864 [Canavalia gladiata]|uniref:Uncharacterized protein n=1 Tax=Canavalia gladiata TaxID=3824 RepID=A0AAN9MVG5_CANGL
MPWKRGSLGFLGKLGLKSLLLSIKEEFLGEKGRGKKLVLLEIAPNRKSFHHALHQPVKPPLIEEGIGPSYSQAEAGSIKNEDHLHTGTSAMSLFYNFFYRFQRKHVVIGGAKNCKPDDSNVLAPTTTSKIITLLLEYSQIATYCCSWCQGSSPAFIVSLFQHGPVSDSKTDRHCVRMTSCKGPSSFSKHVPDLAYIVVSLFEQDKEQCTSVQRIAQIEVGQVKNDALSKAQIKGVNIQSGAKTGSWESLIESFKLKPRRRKTSHKRGLVVIAAVRHFQDSSSSLLKTTFCVESLIHQASREPLLELTNSTQSAWEPRVKPVSCKLLV